MELSIKKELRKFAVRRFEFAGTLFQCGLEGLFT